MLTLDEIKARTVHLPQGWIAPRQDGTWEVFVGSRRVATADSRRDALEEYQLKADEGDKDICLNCGS